MNTIYSVYKNLLLSIKGGYLDFSHLTELKNVCITEIYKIIKNHKITQKIVFDGVPIKDYVAS